MTRLRAAAGLLLAALASPALASPGFASPGLASPGLAIPPAALVPPMGAGLPTGTVVRDSGTGQRLLMTAAAAPRQATEPMPRDPPGAAVSRSLALRQGSGQILRLAGPAANVFVADPKVAEVHPAGPSTLFVFGVGAGRTTIAALGADGRLIGAYDVTVQPSEFSARAVATEIDRLVPGGHIRVRAQPKGLLLTGWVETPAEAAQAVAVAQGFLDAGQALQDQITVRASVQVTLQVRIVQMSRTLSDKLGINWTALGNVGMIGALSPALGLALNGGVSALAGSTAKGLSVAGALDALASDGLLRLLAEPNLTVISGQPASFLVGGEIPVPVPGQNGQVTVEYKKYGVSLNFLPTVFSSGRINIHVAPEVSQPSNTSTVTITAANQTFQVPSFTVSRAETTVQLGSGQSFAIGGLLQDTLNDGASGIPNVSSIPILGALFRDDQFTRQQTELVIIVTPYIVRPVDSVRRLQTPDQTYTAPSDLQRLLFMRQVGTPRHWEPVPVPGDAGFMVQ